MAALDVLHRPGYRRLLIGQAVSALGDWMGTVALMAIVFDLTDSAAAVGVILVLRLAPAGLAAPIAAGVARRWDRRRIMLTTDLLRAGIVALVPLVRAAWWVYVWAFLLEVANLVFLPARDASVPDLIDHEEHLPTANGLVFGSSYGSIPLGAAAFAGLTSLPLPRGTWLAHHQGALALWLDALTYLVSFAFIRKLDVLGPAGGPERAGEQGEGGRFLAALRLPVVRAVLPATAAAMGGVGALFSLGIVFVRQVLQATTVQFGFLVALFGVGGMAGWAWLQFAKGGRAGLPAVRLGVGGMGVVLAAMSLASTIVLADLAAVPFGMAAATALIAGITYLQESLDEEQRVLGLAAYHVVVRVGMSAAAIVAGLLAQVLPSVRLPLTGELKPPALVLFVAGLLMVLGALLLPARLREEPGGRPGEVPG